MIRCAQTNQNHIEKGSNDLSCLAQIVSGPARGPIDSSEQQATDDGQGASEAGPSSLVASTSNPRALDSVQEANTGNTEEEAQDEQEDDDEEEEGNTAEDDLKYFPISHEAILKDHTKVCSLFPHSPSTA